MISPDRVVVITLSVINEGRERWRLIQLASAVRDCSKEAARFSAN